MSEEKSKTLIKFGLYMLFLFVVVGLVITTGASPSSSRKNTNTEIHKKTYLEKEDDLISDAYKYTFKIDNGITFNGSSSNGKRTGTKEENGTTIQYIEEEQIYKIVNNEKELYENLYDGLDTQLFNFKSLFEKLNKEDCLIDRTEDETIYSYTDVLGYNIDITTNEEHITEIKIEGTLKYTFEFTY